MREEWVEVPSPNDQIPKKLQVPNLNAFASAPTKHQVRQMDGLAVASSNETQIPNSKALRPGKGEERGVAFLRALDQGDWGQSPLLKVVGEGADKSPRRMRSPDFKCENLWFFVGRLRLSYSESLRERPAPRAWRRISTIICTAIGKNEGRLRQAGSS